MKSPLTGSFVCYHYFIGTDGTTIQTRGDDERPGCTMNDIANDHSLQIVLAGADDEKPSHAQVRALKKLVNSLQKKYNIQGQNIIGHGEASSTSCPGIHIMSIINYYRKLL